VRLDPAEEGKVRVRLGEERIVVPGDQDMLAAVAVTMHPQRYQPDEPDLLQISKRFAVLIVRDGRAARENVVPGAIIGH
jgi:hypothetical protein